MIIQQVQIHNFRVIEHLTMQSGARMNLIYGGNGAGKTSILEAIYLAGRGRSFRHSEAGPFIRHQSRSCQVIVRTQGEEGKESVLGIERAARDFKFRLNGQDLHRRSDLLRALPLQLITPHSHELLERGPDIRRRYLDLGLFHVEPRYHDWLNAYNRAIKQRNAAMRNSPRIAAAWDEQLEVLAWEIHKARTKYLERLIPTTFQVLCDLNDTLQIDINFKPGWDTDKSFAGQLADRLQSDMRQGYTSVGPHRADLQLTSPEGIANKRLSRGQLKLVVTAMNLAQAMLMKAQTDESPVFLFDDLPAELDRVHRQRLIGRLCRSGMQCFITAVDREQLDIEGDWKVFHVEQGRCEGASSV